MDQRFSIYLKERQEQVNAALEQLLPAATTPPVRLHEAQRYAVLGAGKRIRPVLVLAAGEAVGGDDRQLMPAACALEVLHAYTLVHDDLPAMDDDDFRRGRPTCHKAFDEPTAILAGDGLQALAFALLVKTPVAPERVVRATQLFAEAAGSCGVVGGQAADMGGEERVVTLPELEFIHRHKTGKLLVASVAVGGILAGGSDEQVRALIAYGEHGGLAFQIIDDLLDVLLTTEELGKDAGSDAANGKATYPALLGLDESIRRAEEEVAAARAALTVLGERAWPLAAMADYFIARLRQRRERTLQTGN
ncbi:MAG TPA: polyprenyl synthetase family protein [bacterium]|nr:polyprenyl synthetase family protein [bacterium]